MTDSESTLVFYGVVPAAKQRATNGTTFEVQLVLQHAYEHAGGGLVLLLSTVSEPTVIGNLTTATRNDTSRGFLGTFLDDAVLSGDEGKTLKREKVLLVKFMPGTLPNQPVTGVAEL